MIKYQEKEYGTSEQARLNALSKMRELKRAGYVARVVYGHEMQFIVRWHNKPVKKSRPHKKINRRETLYQLRHQLQKILQQRCNKEGENEV